MGDVDPIRVLQVADKFAMRGAPIHGMARLLMAWVLAFRGSRVHFEICVLRGHEGGVSDFEEIGATVIDLNRSKMDPRTVFDIARLIRECEIDIVHCHGYGATNFGRIAARICGVPVIVHEHMVEEDVPLYQRLADLSLSRLTTLGIAVSSAVARFMVEGRYIPSDRVETVFQHDFFARDRGSG